jgi:hypothetical protein
VYFLPPPLPTRIANNFQQRRPAEEEIIIDRSTNERTKRFATKELIEKDHHGAQHRKIYLLTHSLQNDGDNTAEFPMTQLVSSPKLEGTASKLTKCRVIFHSKNPRHTFSIPPPISNPVHSLSRRICTLEGCFERQHNGNAMIRSCAKNLRV